MNELVETPTKELKKYTYKPSKKNDLFMEYWTDPTSQTFGNVYKSGIKAGFSKTYSKNLLNVAPQWLLTYIDKTNFTADHIKIGIQKLATRAPESRSPDDTRLKAYEILAKITGMIDSKHGTTTNILVQPILGGSSVVKHSSTDDKHSDNNLDKDSNTPTIDTHVVEPSQPKPQNK